ncbi:hypothetical protein QTL97_14650 [Sporosarcina thermotolerans]|uniref:Uncharacterized protein n=1 Tax=Sporosarcina thermotolerans TaxID=633404 RepID=A0AAW9AAW2_9BACL|nr:hypothetical protein [Sporosarcina thermotolerans]MDW0118169.1 hypothetical protein [Sporosarcina thermotolerans]WHT47654.1 hypothetical protein QNH10_16190 [Sporosarcina thermotolerans]
MYGYVFIKSDTELIGVEGGDSCESRYEERLLRVKAQRYEQGVVSRCLNFCKGRRNTANRTLRGSIGKRPPETEINGIKLSLLFPTKTVSWYDWVHSFHIGG